MAAGINVDKCRPAFVCVLSRPEDTHRRVSGLLYSCRAPSRLAVKWLTWEWWAFWFQHQQRCSRSVVSSAGILMTFQHWIEIKSWTLLIEFAAGRPVVNCWLHRELYRTLKQSHGERKKWIEHIEEIFLNLKLIWVFRDCVNTLRDLNITTILFFKSETRPLSSWVK